MKLKVIVFIAALSLTNAVAAAVVEYTDRASFEAALLTSTTQDFEGIPVETREARPLWVKIDDIPYEKMWEDDKLWLPPAMSGKYIKGRFIFDGEKMISQQIEESQMVEESQMFEES